MRLLNTVDSLYVVISCFAGVWEAWCITYGRDDVFALVCVVLMGFPFAFASRVYNSFSKPDAVIGERKASSGMSILWAGMPFSFLFGALCLAGISAGLSAFGLVPANFPFDSILFFGEGAASLAWTLCILMWSRQPDANWSRLRFLLSFAALFAGALGAHGISLLVLGHYHRDLYWFLEFTIVTTISAIIIVILREHEACRGPELNFPSST